MNKKTVAQELLKMAKSLISETGVVSVDVSQRQYELMQEAKDKGIKLTFKDKHTRGETARGPKKWREFNVVELEDAIKDDKKEVVLWRE